MRHSQAPSEATFSRVFAEFAQGDLPAKMHAARIEHSLGGRVVGVIACDATEIEAREKPARKEAEDKKDDPPPSDGAPPPREARTLAHKLDQRFQDSNYIRRPCRACRSRYERGGPD